MNRGMTGWKEMVAVGALLLAALWLWPSTARAGRLGSVRSEVSGSSSSDSSSSSSSSSSSDSSSSDDDSSSSYCCYGGSSSSIHSDGTNQPPARLRYRAYPYRGGSRDYMRKPRAADDRDRLHAGQVWGEGAYQGQGLWRGAGGLRIDGQLFSVDGDLSYYLEPAANDALYLGTANLSLIPFHLPHGLFRIGGGINTMIDGRVPGQGHREYALGWNVTTSLDLFPTWPVVLSGRVDAGKLYQAVMVRARGSVGVMLWRIELFGGYEHTQVGRVGMGGPMAGMRVWL